MGSFYETGTASTSYDLAVKLRAFLLESGVGWTEQAHLGDSDFVFYSSGESGEDDLYIRIASGLSDAVSKIGDIQHPYSDGYTGFINLFAYQYFPSSGTSGDDGHNELGRFGPVLYVAEDAGTFGHINEYNLAKSTPLNARYRKVVTLLGDTHPLTSAFDGKRFIYQHTSSTTTNNKVDLYDNSVASKNYATTSAGYLSTTPYVRLEDGSEYIYQTSSSGTSGAIIHRYDIFANSWTYTGFDDPPWGAGVIYSGCMCVGPRRRRTADNYWMYLFRGNATTAWARFDLASETWSVSMTPVAPWAVGNSGTTYKSFCLFVPKEQTGYTYDRIYLWRSNNTTDFASIAIGDDGDVPGGEVWTIHGDTPYSQFNGINAICLGGKIMSTGGAGATQALYEFEFPVSPASAGTWTTINSSWLQYAHSNSPNIFDLHNHLAGRIRVSESATNTYWAFADKDRVVFVVKNDWGEYEYGYAGKFRSYSNPLTNGQLLKTVRGGSTAIEVSNPEFFEIGRTYMIVDTTGQNSAVVTSDFSGTSKRLAASETFTVLVNDGSGTMIITELLSDYFAGSKVGEDPVPVMVRSAGSDKALTFDTINLVDNDGYTDPSWQYYRLMPTISDTVADSTDPSIRSGEIFLYGISVVNEGDNYSGKEARGELIGVHAGGVGIASETEVPVGSKTYIAFDIADSGQNQRIIVGPK